MIEGHVFDSKGKEKVYIHGNWHSHISIKNLTTGKDEGIWNVSPKVPNSEHQYAFNKFLCNLNYIDDEMKKVIAPTDTRLRPDQRYYEEFKIDPAAQHKNRIEDKQRTVRKILEKQG